jgi:hypothetical protein
MPGRSAEKRKTQHGSPADPKSSSLIFQMSIQLCNHLIHIQPSRLWQEIWLFWEPERDEVVNQAGVI